MNHKTYYIIVGCVLGIVSVAHLVRAILGISLVIDGWTALIWLSWIGFLVAGLISFISFRFASGE